MILDIAEGFTSVLRTQPYAIDGFERQGQNLDLISSSNRTQKEQATLEAENVWAVSQ